MQTTAQLKRLNMSLKSKLPFFECEYCGKRFAKQQTADRHSCDKMKKYKLCKTKRGATAFSDYNAWMAALGRRATTLDTFVDSKYFNTLVEFQKFAGEKGIPDKKLYIRYMASKQLLPNLWRDERVYQAFIAYFDEDVPPIRKVKISLSTIFTLSGIIGCKEKDVFKHLLPSEIARLICERRLSPWLLLLSKRFMHYLHMLTDQNHYIMINSLIDANQWRSTFRNNKETVEIVKGILSQLDL